jgi:SAM-dependent methyltransferase
MNEAHLEICASPEWAEMVERWIVPWVLETVDLGDDVLEIGPGPGLTTEVLRTQLPRLTALEYDDDLAAALAERLVGTNVEVVHGDATRMDLPSDRFSGAVSLNMLHHVPSAALQDQVFAELCRVLRPGGVLAGQDSLANDSLAELHVGDTYVPVDPETLAHRLTVAGFTAAVVDTNEYAVRFRARKP